MNSLKTANSKLLSNYSSLSANKEKLKKDLIKLATKVLEETQFPLVFIVDELDRCRPTFAIEVLERIKHLFNINNMVFVLGIARNELSKSIKSVYGEIDVENYLHRFIDLEFRLPQADSPVFFKNLLNQYGIEKYITDKINEYIKDKKSPANQEVLSNDNKLFNKYFCDLLRWKDFSLREIEQCLKIYTLALKEIEVYQPSWPVLLAIVIVLRLKEDDIYEKFMHKKSNWKEITDSLIPDRYLTFGEIHTSNLILATLYRVFRDETVFPKISNSLRKLRDVLEKGGNISIFENVPEFLKKYYAGITERAKFLDSSTYAMGNEQEKLCALISAFGNAHDPNYISWDTLVKLSKRIDFFNLKSEKKQNG